MEKKSIDMTLTLVVLFMIVFGMIMVSSVSVYDSYRVTSALTASGKLYEPNTTFFIERSLRYALLGLVFLIVFSKIPYYIFEKYTKKIFLIAVAVLILVLFIGQELKGAKGWINVPYLPTIQPVEFAKIAFVMMLAFFMKRNRSLLTDFSRGCVPFGIYVIMILVPLMLQPDFGSILILTPVALMMYFIGGGNKRYLTIALICSLIGAISVYALGKITSVNEQGKQVKSSLSYISDRIDNFLRPNKDIALSRTATDKKKNQRDYQLKQGFVALGSGGLFGLGFGNSIQKYGYLPEVYGDFIFSVIIEELGFVGGLVLIFSYVLIGFRGFMIAQSVKDLFGKYLAFGITSWILVQAFINIGVNLNIIPLTGVTLPFISYGGSSIVSLAIAVGILLSISRHMEYKPQNLSDALQARRKIIF